MANLLESGRTVVSRLVVRGGGMDSLSTRLRMTTLLGGARLHPPGLPASAIVFIRELRDPLPGVINLQQNNLRPPLAWEQALAAAVDQKVSSAARPADGHVPANAEAVLFADRSEMLSCLAADWCAGSAITRWWWRSLFRSTDVTSAVVSEWLTAIECVPAAFTKLARMGFAITFASTLPAGVVSRMLDQITWQFGLAEFRKSLSPSRKETQPGASDEAREPVSNPTELLSSGEVAELRTRWAPEAFAPQLDENARALLAVALMLERAPSLLRERRFAARLFLSLLPAETPEVIAPPNETLKVQMQGTAPGEGQVADYSGRKQVLTSRKGDDETQTGGRDIRNEISEARILSADQCDGPPVQIADDRKVEPALLAPIPSSAEPVQARVDSDPVVTAAAAAPAIKELPATAIKQSETTAASIETAIETKMGGVFYLINAAMALNLYGDFTRPLDPGIELPIWDFLALIGRQLIGKRIERDPIWQFLAKLAGRFEGTHAREEPGARFKPPDEWRVPPDWLDAFPERDGWSYRINRGRLIVGHPAGFDVLDLKLGPRFSMRNIMAKLERETLRYQYVGEIKRRRGAPRGRGTRKRERDLDRWTQLMADYFGPRLARSLGIGTADDLAEILFARAARVNATPARLDVFFSLADLPIEIRLAGLDRDPGWMPAAGRAIAFHYE